MFLPAKSALKKSSGQAVLLVILGMAVALTVVLSVVSRSVTDVSVTSIEEDSSKAFSAAEAGIEKLLVGESSVSNLDLGNMAFIQSAQAMPLGEGQNYFDFNESYNSGDEATIWFVSHDDRSPQRLTCTSKPCFNGNDFSILWNGNAAVEVVIYYDILGNSGVISSTPNFSGVRVKRFVFDSDNVRRESNKFSSPEVRQGSEYLYSTGNISLSGLTRPLFARVKFIYSGVNGFRVSVANGVLPSQGRLLVSKGTAGSSVRQVELRDYYRSSLDVFELGVFSQGDLVK